MKVAFVVQRYGTEVNGGSEFLCRLLAERMSRHWDLEVLTSCALDYRTWQDEYEPGLSKVNGVSVRRFRVDYPRTTLLFDRTACAAYSHLNDPVLQARWGKEQGPYSSDFLRHLESQGKNYDVFFFFTYLYGFTLFGLPKVADRSILVPTAHDEPPIYLPLFNSLFSAPRGLLFQTPEEQEFVQKRFSLSLPHEVVSTGIDDPIDVPVDEFKKTYADFVNEPYILYLGRIDESKGCGELFDFFVRFRNQYPERRIRLLLAGKPVMQIPKHPDILSLGFIEERFKFAALKEASLLAIPSAFESLSLVTLEAWLQGIPVLANGNSHVLRGQCTRAQGGRVYQNYEEFTQALGELLDSPDLREKMGKTGRKYVLDHYRWESVEKSYLQWASKVSSLRAGA